MPANRLSASDLAATTETTLYSPSGVSGVVTLSLCNRNSTGCTVRVALASAATPTAGEWIEYDSPLPANGVLERGGIVIGDGQYLVGYSSVSGVSAVVWGITQ